MPLSKPGAPYSPLSASDVSSIKLFNVETGVDCLFYGIQAALFIATLSVLARRKNRSTFMTAAITCLFVSSTITVTLGLLLYAAQFPIYALGDQGDREGFDSLLDRYTLNIVVGAAFRFNYLISDAVVVWRAWILWPNNWIVKALLAVCLAGSTVGVIVECAWVQLSTSTGGLSGAKTLMKTVPLLVTNTVATVLIGLRVWLYRREVKIVHEQAAKRTKAENILVLLVESGSLYCLLWVVGLATGAVYGDKFYTFSVGDIIDAAIHDISGIYPSFVILAVALQGEETSTLLSSAHPLSFAHAPRADDSTVPDIESWELGERPSEGMSQGKVKTMGDKSWPGTTTEASASSAGPSDTAQYGSVSESIAIARRSMDHIPIASESIQRDKGL
ncbi:hypothetical protein BD626DRAFT_472262 [Schizophyllum amplum]|uniref:Uncharacterized protein n=1 Tax=Schizophyllum amplum TaxID=97359 RepID=A0A550CVS1_9AGAR|nr:hypothetical protein BD626DRAFT_472262 [Auriculariopsis ampla]